MQLCILAVLQSCSPAVVVTILFFYSTAPNLTSEASERSWLVPAPACQQTLHHIDYRLPTIHTLTFSGIMVELATTDTKPNPAKHTAPAASNGRRRARR